MSKPTTDVAEAPANVLEPEAGAVPEGRLARFANAFEVPVATITGAQVETYLRGLGRSGRTQNNHRRIIGTLFKFAVRRGYLPKDHSELDAVEHQKLIAQALETDRVVRNAIAENSLNPQNIETAIRKGLLPKLFSLVGLESAKFVVEQVIQITRVGLSRG